jgi:uncharacterized protein YfaS (alpha-2-macroglobulin family)
MARSGQWLKHNRVGAVLVVVCAVVVAGVLTGVVTGPDRSTAAPQGKTAAPIPLFVKTTPATNTTSLILAVDEKKVLGWISGSVSYAGQDVTVHAGKTHQTVLVKRDNTFTWHYTVAADTQVTFELAKLSGKVRVGPPAKHKPSVFFVVDRTVYRPGHKLQFAGFLRDLDAGGTFTPIANKSVEVVIRSKQKKTVAGKLTLRSDARGRIAGDYRFMGEDTLGDYTLTIQGFAGDAQVKLAEFRKAKVRLQISGKRVDDVLRLKFEARDFLNKPVPAQRVQFTAKVFHRAQAPTTNTLNAAQFVYHHETPAAALPDGQNLTEEQLYRWTYEGIWPRTGMTLLAQVSGKVPMGGKETVSHDLELKSQWLAGKCVVQVEGVLIDENDREQRATKTIPLDAASKDGQELTVTVPKRIFVVGEKVPITVSLGKSGKTSPLPRNTSLVVMRTVGAQAAAYSPYMRNGWYGNRIYAGSQYRGRQINRLNVAYPGWVTHSRPSASTGEMITAAAVDGGKVTVTLDSAGTYDLVAVTQLADGTRLRSKASCTVLGQEDRTIVLKMDKREYHAGQMLEGELHSRFTGAKILLTLRDSRGIRLWRTIDMPTTAMRFSMHLPANLNYGCSLVAQHVDRDGQIFTAHRNIRVVPSDRMLDITTTVPKTVEPGKDVTLKMKVNRLRPVDLVVSVYDESLLGIAADKSVNIRNFYLADERAFSSAARDIIRRTLGDVTAEELVNQAKKIIKDNPKSPRAALAQQLVASWNRKYVYSHQLSLFLQFAGVPCRSLDYYRGWYCYLRTHKGFKTRLVDILAHKQGAWSLSNRYYNDLLVLAETHPSYRGRAYGYGYGQMLYDGGWGRGRYATRGDSMRSMSGNALVSGQSFISHMPVAGPPVVNLMPDTAAGDVSVRRDFSDSAFWNASVRTDSRGEATVNFKLPDSLTNWRVVVTAVTGDMHVGQKTDSFRTYKPIMVWPMIPRVFTEGDEVRLFARVHNRTDSDKVIRVKLKVDNGKVDGRDTVSVRVGPKDSAAVYWTYRPGSAGYAQLLMTADCDAGSDASLKRMPVVPPCAVEQLITSAGFCADSAKFNVPADVDLTGAKLELTLVPSVAADMVDSLDYLVRYPHGCAEQTMSKFVPAVKVSGMLKAIGLKVPKLEAKLPKYVAIGIKKLINYQRSDGGWGWNGNGRTHEMMTPYVMYGLLEAEAAGYTLPNETAITRGLGRLKQFIDRMNANQAADRIYCMYVYSMRKPMQAAWWAFIADQDDKNKLSDYATAMALEMAVRGKKAALAKSLVRKLRKRAVVSGGEVNWTTAKFTKWGDDPHEITAAVLKALVAFDVKDPLIPGVLSYFASTKRGKRWNSTKDTAMILFAMCDYLAARDMPLKANASVRLAVNGGENRTVEMTGGLMKKIVIPGTRLRKKDNIVKFDRADGGTMYRLVFRYRKIVRDVGPFASGVKVTRKLHLLDAAGKELREIKPGDTVPRGSYIRSRVDVRRLNKSSMSYVLVESPKPSCAEVVPVGDKRFAGAIASTTSVLREDKTHAVLWHHERTSSQIVDQAVFYAELAGEYTIPPAYAELMYKTTVRGHSGTFRFKIKDKG